MDPEEARIAALASPDFERSVSEPAQATDRDHYLQGGGRPSLPLSLLPCEGELADPRRAVVAPVVQLKLEPLPDSLRSPPKPRHRPRTSDGGYGGTRPLAKSMPAQKFFAKSSSLLSGLQLESDSPPPLSELLGRYAAMLCSPCISLRDLFGKAERGIDARIPSSAHPPHRWFRIHPIGDGRYFVRPDAGWRGRVPGSRREGDSNKKKEQDDEEQIKSHHRIENIRRTKSTPGIWERRIGLKDPPGFQQDTFRNLCCVCYEMPVQVITLPCRHGCLCEECLRRTLFSRPAHRGGRMCPICRRNVSEVVWIYGDAAIPQYGFTIKS